MTKKIIKILSLNLVVLIVLIIATDFCLYLKYRHDYYAKKSAKIAKLYPFPSYTRNYKTDFPNPSYQFFKDFFKQTDYSQAFRHFNTDSSNTKAPVMIFGCSYGYGILLKDKQTFNYKLSKMTHRNVYNFSMCACGIQHMLYFIQNNLGGLVGDQKPEYAVFIYIPSHLDRLKKNIFPDVKHHGVNLQYDLKDDKLILREHSSNFLYKSFLVKHFLCMQDKWEEKNTEQYKNDCCLLAKAIFSESKKELQKKYPNIKFVILNFQTEKDDSNYELPYFFESLKKDGFIVINTSDIIGRKFKYNSKDMEIDGYHPSEAAWDMILPKFIKETGM